MEGQEHKFALLLPCSVWTHSGSGEARLLWWRQSALLSLPIQNCQPLSETPSQTHPEKCFTSSSGHPLVQSVTHAIKHHNIWIHIPLVLVFWRTLTDTLWPASIEQLGNISAKSEEGSCHWCSGDLQGPRQAGCRGPERHIDQVKRLQTRSSLDQLRTRSKKQSERSGAGWFPLGQVLVGWEDHTPQSWAARCSLDPSICHASPPPDGAVTRTSLQLNQEPEDGKWPCSLKNQRSESTEPVAAAYPGAW